jgi:hypothetical protein
MNKLLFTVFVISFPLVLKAQDYQTVNSGRISYFENPYGEVKCINIDSVKFQTDSILYPVSNIQNTGYECYTPYGASWLSSKVILQADGSNLFFNLKLDTILIKTKALLNESWISYEIADSVKIIATVLSTDTCKFLGQSDSVKIIGFKIYDKNMGLINHSLNEMTIGISKFHGLIRTLNFSFFPDYDLGSMYDESLAEYNLIGLSNPNAGIQNLTWFEAHDFQVGDEIHILNESYSWGPGCSENTNIKTIRKYIDRKDYPDSIVYTFERTERKDGFVNGVDKSGYFHDTITYKITSYPYFDNFPFEPYIIESAVCINKMYNGIHVSKSIDNHVMYFSDNDCWRSVLEDGCITEDYYIKGLGGPYYECSGGIDCYSQINNRPVYSKKGNSTWGTPLIIDDIPLTEVGNKIVVYPNPSKDEIRINSSLSTEPFTFEIIDLRGQVVFKKELTDQNNSVKPDESLKGVYLYRIIMKTEIITGKLIIE